LNIRGRPTSEGKIYCEGWAAGANSTPEWCLKIKGEKDDDERREVKEAAQRIQALSSKPLSQVDADDLVPLAKLCLCRDHRDEKQIASVALRWRLAIFFLKRGYIRTSSSVSTAGFERVQDSYPAPKDYSAVEVPDGLYGLVINTIWREIQRGPLGLKLFQQPKDYVRLDVRETIKKARGKTENSRHENQLDINSKSQIERAGNCRRKMI
jgi:hypothetical protein